MVNVNQKSELSKKYANKEDKQNFIKNILLNVFVLSSNPIWLFVIITTMVAAILIPNFISPGNILNIIVQMVPIGMTIYAMGFCLMTGFFDLSLESTYAVAPIIGVIIMKSFPNFPGIAYIGIVIVIVIGGIVGLVNGFLSVKLNINPFLVTISTMLILRGLALFFVPYGLYNLPKPYIFLGSYRLFNNQIPISIIFFIIVIIILSWVLSKKTFGRHLLAVGSNERAAYLVGIMSGWIKIKVSVIAGVLAAMGGLIAAGRQNAVLNGMGEGNMVIMFAGAILGGVSLSGGVGSISGILGGIVLLQIISNIIILLRFDPFLIKSVHGSILLIALLLQALRQIKFKKN
jgi:simple sugar transport system permease protein/ribose transport system permease protein